MGAGASVTAPVTIRTAAGPVRAAADKEARQMSSVSSTYSSSSRITGMYSDLDTDSLVKSMCSGQQSKIDKQEQKKTTYEWYNEAVNDVISAVKEFSNTYCSVLGTSSMLKSSTYSAYSVTSNSSSGAVTIEASGSAQEGSVSVKVNQLAVQANTASAGKISADGTGISSSNTTTLSELSFANTLKFDSSGNISFSINGKTFSFSKDSTLQNMISTVSNDEDAGVTMTYSRLTDGFIITADSGGKDGSVSIVNLTGNAFGTDGAFQIGNGTVKNGQNSIALINGTTVEQDSNEYTFDGLTYTLNAVTAQSDSESVVVRQLAKSASVSSSEGVSSGSGLSSDNTATLAELDFANELTFGSSNEISFSINGRTFTFYKTTTLQEMLDTVNSDTMAGVTMQYSRLKDAFTITSDETGADSRISIVNKTGNAFGTDGAFQIGIGLTENGQNSIAVIDGVTVERSDNSYTIDGTDYELTQVTDQSDEYVNFTVSRDFSSTVDAVNSFVDALNTLLTTLNTYITAKDYSDDYQPLTEDQEEEMSDDQIENWNDKAKNGILRYNAELESLVSSLKNAFFSTAGGTGKTSAAVGISGASYYDSEKGLLVVDTDALTAALEKNPDEVISLFTGGNSTSTSANQGLVYKVRNALSAYLENAGDSVDNTEDKIDDIDSEISDLEDKLDTMADKYYEKFSNMETALATLNSQSSYISQLFS